MSKSIAQKNKDEERAKSMPKKIQLIGDAKKDKLKNSLLMTNEEREKLVNRERVSGRNRGMCMVSDVKL